MFGVVPTTPGFDTFDICLRPGNISSAVLKTPTVKGDIMIYYKFEKDALNVKVDIPANTKAHIKIPNMYLNAVKEVTVNDKKYNYVSRNNYIELDVCSGHYSIKVK
jgi:hypothetical protein